MSIIFSHDEQVRIEGRDEKVSADGRAEVVEKRDQLNSCTVSQQGHGGVHSMLHFHFGKKVSTDQLVDLEACEILFDDLLTYRADACQQLELNRR